MTVGIRIGIVFVWVTGIEDAMCDNAARASMGAVLTTSLPPPGSVAMVKLRFKGVLVGEWQAMSCRIKTIAINVLVTLKQFIKIHKNIFHILLV